MHLANCRSRTSPTDSSDEAQKLGAGVDDRSSAPVACPATTDIVYARFPKSNGPERSTLALGGALHVGSPLKLLAQVRLS